MIYTGVHKSWRVPTKDLNHRILLAGLCQYHKHAQGCLKLKEQRYQYHRIICKLYLPSRSTIKHLPYIYKYYQILNYIVLYIIILYFVILCYIILYCIILYYVILYYIVLYYIILYYILLYYIILYLAVTPETCC